VTTLIYKAIKKRKKSGKKSKSDDDSHDINERPAEDLIRQIVRDENNLLLFRIEEIIAVKINEKFSQKIASEEIEKPLKKEYAEETTKKYEPLPKNKVDLFNLWAERAVESNNATKLFPDFKYADIPRFQVGSVVEWKETSYGKFVVCYDGNVKLLVFPNPYEHSQSKEQFEDSFANYSSNLYPMQVAEPAALEKTSGTWKGEKAGELK